MKNVMKYYLSVVMFLLPVSFLPVVVDSWNFGKNWIMLILGLVGIVLWLVELLIEKKNVVHYNLGLILAGILTVWAGYWWTREAAGVQMSSFMNSTGMGVILTVFVWWFLWSQYRNKEDEQMQLNFLTAGGILTFLVSLVVFVLPASKMPLIWPKDNPIVSLNMGWSLTGTMVSEVILMLFLVVEWGKRLLERTKEGKTYMKEAIMMAVMGIGLLLGTYRMFKAGLSVLDGNSSWVIAVESFKRDPWTGAGPGNFVEAFNLYRPASYNATKFWTNTFSESSSGLLNVWTETGIVGLIVMLLLTYLVIRSKKNFEWIKMAIFGVIVLFTPVNIVGLLLTVWLLANYLGENKKAGLVLKVGENGMNGAPWILTVVVALMVAFGGYWLVRIMIGDMFMRQALLAAAKNDGGTTYNLEIKAMGFNPTNAGYRRMYSQTNMALAKTLLANKDISDDDKQKASVLVQQAVREAKNAVALDGSNTEYWVNLAAIYRELVGMVDGVADYSYQAYTQAVALDPVNPNTQLDLGGLLFAAQRYDDADRVFEQVVTNKPDFANGWYNWAYTAKNLNKIDVAVQRLTQAVALVPKDSGDYDKANKELDDWKVQLQKAIDAQKAQQQAQASPTPTPKPETLRTSEPLPTGTEEKVNVPKDQLAPPAVSPTPTPTTPVGNPGP